MIGNVQGVATERRERLIKVLDVDPGWYMNKVSDGQRRRVQICMGLLRPFKVHLSRLLRVYSDHERRVVSQYMKRVQAIVLRMGSVEIAVSRAYAAESDSRCRGCDAPHDESEARQLGCRLSGPALSRVTGAAAGRGHRGPGRARCAPGPRKVAVPLTLLMPRPPPSLHQTPFRLVADIAPLCTSRVAPRSLFAHSGTLVSLTAELTHSLQAGRT